MISVDSHVHTSLSHDAIDNLSSEPENVIREAIKKGLSSICITDHQDWNDPSITYKLTAEDYFKALAPLKEKYKKEIDVNIGVELGLDEKCAEAYRRFTDSNPFGIIIGSVHCINGEDPFYGRYFKGKTSTEAFHEAFQYTISNLKTSADFDILGHIDYVVRYSPYGDDTYSYELFHDDLDEILQSVIETGRGIEVNTSGLKYGLKEPHPCRGIVKRYRELGGEIITVGSDAHDPKYLAYGFPAMEELLKDCGFTYYTEIKNRRHIFHKL